MGVLTTLVNVSIAESGRLSKEAMDRPPQDLLACCHNSTQAADGELLRI